MNGLFNTWIIVEHWIKSCGETEKKKAEQTNL